MLAKDNCCHEIYILYFFLILRIRRASCVIRSRDQECNGVMDFAVLPTFRNESKSF